VPHGANIVGKMKCGAITMKAITVAGATITVAVLAGCATMQNLSANDLRKPEYTYRTETLDMTMPQIRTALFEYRRNCRSFGSFDYDPSGNGRMVIEYEGMGATQSSIYFVVDLDGRPDGKTQLKSYTYYTTWHVWVDNVISAIKSPNVCT
jgi:hypothetical protein